MPRVIKRQALERLKTTYKTNQGVLLPAVQRHVMRKASEPEEFERRTDIMHPSDMSKPDWCGRADFYRITTGVSHGDANPSFSMENIFDEGHRIHKKYQHWLWDMGLLYGVFMCKECEHVEWDTSPKECGNCGSVRLRYREIPLEDPYLMIAGHADGGVLDGKEWVDIDEPVLIEVKSMSIGTLRFEHPLLHQRYLDGAGLDVIWRDFKRPFPSHIKQATMYAYLGRETFKKIIFIYECKWNQQVKEFTVTPNFKHIENVLATAKDVAAGVRTGITPDRPSWATQPTDKVCKSCPHRKTCWEIPDGPQAPKPVKRPVAKSSATARRKALSKA